MPDSAQLDAVVVGAGFAGLYQLYKLREAGFNAKVLESAPGVGGTWYWNRYPGARCDVESMTYSYSFSEELQQEWTWSERYATQPEILSYIEHVAERFDLYPDIALNTRVTAATYDEVGRRWEVTCESGETYASRFLIMATGCLSIPKSAELPDLERYAGELYYTSSWPHEPVDFTGKRVGVVGTGSSGIQVIPSIAEQAADLVVFQRTPNFSLPAHNRPLTEEEIADRKATYAEWREMSRVSLIGNPVAPVPTQGTFEVSEQERGAKYQAGWDGGNLVAMLTAFTDTLADVSANETAAEFVRERIHELVDDPDVAETLTPRSHPFGTKRPCLDTAYYSTFNSPHVHLVDLRKTPILSVTESGIETSDRSYEFDALVLATGFDAVTGALTAIDIRGLEGKSIRDAWAAGPRSYMGLAVADFPNLFTITGPMSPSVLSNMLISIEQHVDWITDCMTTLRDRELTEIAATREAEDGWLAHSAEIAASTLYPAADSWYIGANVPGKPRVFMVYLGGVGAYREECDAVVANDYAGFELR
jgi:cation diffusion facilitator CzcD-associated flavoprotein CzcO